MLSALGRVSPQRVPGLPTPGVLRSLGRPLIRFAVVTTSAPHAPVRLDAVTSLRWWAALAVFGHHILNLVHVPAPLEAAMGFGYLGVNFFFVLSGFVLMWSLRPGVDRRTFYWRRFARIYPLHLLTLLLAVPVFYRFHPPVDQPWIKPFDLGVLVLSLLLLQGWSQLPTILFAGNPASWTLTSEAFFYAIFPFAAPTSARRSARWGIGIAVMLGVLLIVIRMLMQLPGTAWLSLVPRPFLHVPEFLMGVALAGAMRAGWRPRLHPLVPATAIALWIAMGVVASTSAPGLRALMWPYNPEAITILCAWLIVATASAELRGSARIMRWRPFVALGEWSFAFYLIHATIMYAVLEAIGFQQGDGWIAILWAGLVLGASVIASWLLHAYVERPVEKRLRSWQQDRRTRRTAALTSGEDRLPQRRESIDDRV